MLKWIIDIDVNNAQLACVYVSNKDLSYRYKIVYSMDYTPSPLYENATTALLSPPNSETNKKRYL